MKSEFQDFLPKNWLKAYKKNSTIYLLKMALFYHGLGLILMYLGSFLATITIPDYEVPQIPLSMFLAISAGVLEESIFFGIPYYFSGNPIVLLGSGIIWSAAHLFNSGIFRIETLSYGAFLFSFPHLLFSIRTWMSKKGWFAVVFHSGWNFGILGVYCSIGIKQCSLVNDTFDVLNVVMAIAAILIIYLAYQNQKKQINRIWYLAPVIVILLSLVILFSDGVSF